MAPVYWLWKSEALLEKIRAEPSQDSIAKNGWFVAELDTFQYIYSVG